MMCSAEASTGGLVSSPQLAPLTAASMKKPNVSARMGGMIHPARSDCYNSCLPVRLAVGRVLVFVEAARSAPTDHADARAPGAAEVGAASEAEDHAQNHAGRDVVEARSGVVSTCRLRERFRVQLLHVTSLPSAVVAA